MYASEKIDNWVFYVPLAYYYQVRLGTLPKLAGWMMIYILPTAYYTQLPAWGYLLMLLSLFTIYELGYILNDTEAIHREAKPSLHLYPENIKYYEAHKPAIWATRIAIGLPFLPVLLLFMFYNYVRNPKFSPLVYPLLVCSRYLPFVLYPWNAERTMLLILSFPLINAIERFSMPKYRAPIARTIFPDENSKTYIRALYYILLSCTLLLAGYTWLQILPILILSVYRTALCILTLFYKPKNYLNG